MSAYHVVQIKRNGVHRHYEIWKNNRRCRELRGWTFNRRDAYDVCRMFNRGK